MDTIFALATGTVKKSGVAIFRISGSQAGDILKEITGQNLPPARQVALMEIFTENRPNSIWGVSRETLDKGFGLFFPSPNSFTGEDVVELHVHGGNAVANAITKLLSEDISKPIRLAEAGEFTRRAFENGKMDLTEVEGLADLLHAETELQRRQALRQMEGSLGKIYQEWREILLKILAHTEAYIDFPDEEIPPHLQKEIQQKIKDLISEIENHLSEGHKGELLREGIRVAILGSPNAGKSSLLNVLSKREVAIVSEEAGTTRDIIEVQMDLGGYLVTLIDTAGLRETENSIEKEGIKRAKKALAESSLCLLLYDATDESEPQQTLSLIESENSLKNKDFLLVANKIDNLKSGQKQPHDHRHMTTSEGGDFNENAYEKQDEKTDFNEIYINAKSKIIKSNVTKKDPAFPTLLNSETEKFDENFCQISVKTNEGMADFLNLLQEKVIELSGFTETPTLTRTRHRIFLKQSMEALTRSLDASLIELQAEDLRVAMTALGRITGRVDVEDLLDVIFSDFCIGK